MSDKAKDELKLQREQRVDHIQRSLVELAELEVRDFSFVLVTVR